MSIQTEWQVATTKEPAHFECNYADLKVQAVHNPATDEIQVRVAHEFDTDWMEGQFDEWLAESMDTELEAMVTKLHPLFRALAARLDDHDERSELREFVTLVESHNPGLIRG